MEYYVPKNNSSLNSAAGQVAGRISSAPAFEFPKVGDKILLHISPFGYVTVSDPKMPRMDEGLMFEVEVTAEKKIQISIV